MSSERIETSSIGLRGAVLDRLGSRPCLIACVVLAIISTGCFKPPIEGATDSAETDATMSADTDDLSEATDSGCTAHDQCPASPNPCLEARCVDRTCELVAAHETTSCDDGAPCTLDDHCDGAGLCVGTAKPCDDGRECTFDSCVAATGACLHDASQCECGTDQDCDDGQSCTMDACDLVTGLCENQPTPDAPCDDGLACTERDRCDEDGLCLGLLKSCSDDRTCTVDTCTEPGGTCTSDPGACACSHDGDCDDGLACSVDTCDADEGRCTQDRTACECASPDDCDDGNPCTEERCDEVQRCSSTPLMDGLSCPDGICLEGRCSDEMVLVLAGSALIGCAGGSCPADTTPQRTLQVPSFLIDRLEVTASRYAQCVEASACTEPQTGQATLRTYGSPFKTDHPVNYVTKPQATAYCAWRGKRLCTEAEWEKGVRGATGFNYPWGQAPVATCERAIMNDGAAGGCGTGQTWPVGSRPADRSPYGVVDGLGNVSEWVQDCYLNNLSGIGADGAAYTGGSCSYTVRKGGSYATPDHAILLYSRPNAAPYLAFEFLGIRCCRTL